MLRHGTTAHARDASAGVVHIDFRFVQSGLQAMYIAREVLQKVHADVKADDVGLILVGEHLLQERSAHLFFHIDDVALAAAGINQNSECERKVRLGSEILNGLWFAVFLDVKVVLGQVGNERSVLVFYVEEKLHHIDVNFQGFGRLLGIVGFLILGFLGRSGLLRSRRRLSKRKWDS